MLFHVALTPQDLLLLAHQDELYQVFEFVDLVFALFVEPDEQIRFAVLDVHL